MTSSSNGPCYQLYISELLKKQKLLLQSLKVQDAIRTHGPVAENSALRAAMSRRAAFRDLIHQGLDGLSDIETLIHTDFE